MRCAFSMCTPERAAGHAASASVMPQGEVVVGRAVGCSTSLGVPACVRPHSAFDKALSTLLHTAHSWQCIAITPAACCSSKAAGAPAPPLGSCSAGEGKPVTLTAHCNADICKHSHMLIRCYFACSKALNAAQAPGMPHTSEPAATGLGACSHDADHAQP